MSILDGCRVLLVEDESLVARLAEDMLLDLGCEVTVTMRLDQALARAQDQAFDLAVLDVNLGDTRSYPVADLLRARGVPFLFATGYGRQGVDPAYQSAPVMQKPYRASQLERLLTHLLVCGEPAPEEAAGARAVPMPGARRRPNAVPGRSAAVTVPDRAWREARTGGHVPRVIPNAATGSPGRTARSRRGRFSSRT